MKSILFDSIRNYKRAQKVLFRWIPLKFFIGEPRMAIYWGVYWCNFGKKKMAIYHSQTGMITILEIYRALKQRA